MGKQDTFWKWVTLFKIARDRAGGWVSIATYLQIAYLMIISSVHGWVIFIACSVFILLVTIIDMVFVIPREQVWMLKNNPEWQELKKLIKEKKAM